MRDRRQVRRRRKRGWKAEELRNGVAWNGRKQRGVETREVIHACNAAWGVIAGSETRTAASAKRTRVSDGAYCLHWSPPRAGNKADGNA